jgi:DNA-directed RNA polymerase subunit N (RpoN/RPB10)
MIIPVKCFTCGNVLADKYLYYQNKVRETKLKKKQDLNDVVYLTESNTEKTIEGKVLDQLELNKMCCRRHMLTHVDIL